MISVIVPVYNVDKYIDKCLESLVIQTHRDFEVIVVDDGSTDTTGAICDAWAKKDSRIKVFHQENKGIASVRNRGLELVQGDYIAWVDGDDYLDSHYLEEMLKELQNEDVDMVMCSFYTDTAGDVKYTGSRIFRSEKIGRQDFLERLYTYGLYSVLWNKLVKRNKYDNIHFPDGRIFEDASVMCQLATNCNRIKIIEKPLYYYRRHKEAITVRKLDETKSIRYINDFYLWLKSDIEVHRKEKNERLIALASRHLCDTILRYSEGIRTNNRGKWKKIFREYEKEIISYSEFSLKTKLKYLVGGVSFSVCRSITKGMRNGK